MKALLRSRKFWIAVFGVGQAVVLEYFDVPEQVWQAIAALAGVLIAGIAIEDHGRNAAYARETWRNTSRPSEP
jgi:hypothetical protein